MTMATARKILIAVIVLVLALGTYVNIVAEPAADEIDRTQWSFNWLKSALEGDVDESALTDTMVEAMAEQGGLTAAIDGIKAQAGPVESYGEPVGAYQQGMWVMAVQVAFEKMSLQAIVTTDAEGKVAGLMFQPVVEAPDVPLKEGAVAEEVSVDAGTGYPLNGTLTISQGDGKLPAALLVWGSGASDRDETLGANRVFAQLASGLAERGIVTLRFDKRTLIYPEIATEPDFSVKQEYIEDVLAALELLKSDERVDANRVYLIGHSQGGMLAPRLASEAGGLAGLALLAGSPRDLSDILYDQEMSIVDGSDTQDSVKMYTDWLAEVQSLYELDEAQAKAHEPMYGGAFNAYYLWEMRQHDATELIRQLRIPTLIMQGSNDHQVYADADYAKYQETLNGEDHVQFKLYEGLNHAFMPSVAENLPDAMLEYMQPAQIPADVLDDLAAFIKGKS